MLKLYLLWQKKSKYYDYIWGFSCLLWDNVITDPYKPSIKHAHVNKYICIYYIKLSLLHFRFTEFLWHWCPNADVLVLKELIMFIRSKKQGKKMERDRERERESMACCDEAVIVFLSKTFVLSYFVKLSFLLWNDSQSRKQFCFSLFSWFFLFWKDPVIYFRLTPNISSSCLSAATAMLTGMCHCGSSGLLLFCKTKCWNPDLFPSLEVMSDVDILFNLKTHTRDIQSRWMSHTDANSL